MMLVGVIAIPAGLSGQLAAPDREASAAAEAPWPMFGRTARHEGRTPVVGVQSGTLAWTFETSPTELGANSPIVGADGAVYVADAAGLTALSATGSLLWRYQPGDRVKVPALGADGRIYVGSRTGLAALEPDGTVAWTYQMGFTFGPVVAPDGTIYVIAVGLLRPSSIGGEAVYALKPDGTLRWRQPVPGASGTPALGPAGTVYVTNRRTECNGEDCFCLGRLLALDPTTGRSRRVFSNPVGCFTTPPVVGGEGSDETVFVATEWGRSLYAILPGDPDTGGELKWKYDVDGFIASPPALGGAGTVYVPSGDGLVYAIRTDGTLAWRYETEGHGGPGEGSLGMTSSAVVGGDGTVYVASQDSYVYALTPDGTLKWRYQTKGEPGERGVIQTSPAISGDGSLYISGWIGNPQPKKYLLYAFGPAPGLAPQ